MIDKNKQTNDIDYNNNKEVNLNIVTDANSDTKL